jgi:hypothetical protein
LPDRQTERKRKRRGNVLRIETVGFGDTRCLAILFWTQAAWLEKKLRTRMKGVIGHAEDVRDAYDWCPDKKWPARGEKDQECAADIQRYV